jgi:hypothetical protein
MRLTPEQREIIKLLIAAADGETTEEHCARMDQLVKGSEEMQSFVLRLLNQEAWLSQHSLHESTRAAGPELATSIRKLLTEAETSTISQAVAGQYASESSLPQSTTASRARSRAKPVVRHWIGNAGSNDSLHWILLATCAAVLVGIGVAIGTWIKPANQFGQAPAFVVENSPDAVGVQREAGVPAANYEARLVQFTSCVWGQEMHPRTSDSLRGGDSLNLIHGLADLELGWPARGTAKVRLEGPAGMVLMADGGVSLNHGKLTANVALDNDRFAVETPLGRVEVTADAKIGVAVSPKSTEIHVFSGDAKVVTSWASDSIRSDTLDVRAEQSLQFVTTETGTVETRRGIAAPEFFVTHIPMTDDLLEISGNYVAAIKDAAPVCYWRFDQPVNGLIRNEMADQYHGQVRGAAEWVKEHGNWTIQCGGWLATDTSPSHVVADRPFKSSGVQSYSLEAWVKPSHFHLGTIAAVLNPTTDVPGVHGMLLELGGLWAVFSGREHPGRVRFLHRSPPATSGGNSCFSSIAYRLRKWQHIVAVKADTEMRLYIDGREVAKYDDTTPRPDGLLLLVGKLDVERIDRVFIGQLDELAYYERALSDEEVRMHYHLARPAQAAPGGI